VESRATIEPPDFTVGRRLTEITVAMDALERARSGDGGPLDGEGLLPIYLGKGVVPETPLGSWADAKVALEQLDADMRAVPDGPRALFLRAMIRSLHAAVRIFAGEPISFQEKLTDLVGVPAEPVPDETIAELRTSLDGLLRKLGYGNGGTLVERVRRWESDRLLHADDLPTVFQRLMDIAKQRTDSMIFETGDYMMRLNPMRGVPYTARCAFDEGNMDINLDVGFTRAALKHLVCHEVFPGHSTQLLFTLDRVKRGLGPADALLCTTNGATGAVQEGIGDQGVELIEWVEDEDDAAHIELRRLQTATGTNAAWHLNVSGWSAEQSVAYLVEAGCGQEAWARGRTAMGSHAFRGAFVASYWFGNEAVKEVRERTPASARPAFIEYLYGRVNTPQSLRAFAA
jgi:hypothetical protein